MREYLVTAPGLLGDLARYIYGRLNNDEPGIALSAALSFMGALMSGRVASETGVESNLYVAIVAESGIGKSQAQNVLKEIVTAAGLESVTDFLMGKPASDSGLLSALNRSPKQLKIWDEFGIALSALSNSKATHEALILSQIMELYSSAGKPLKGKEYATKDRVDIQGGAYLSIFGASTPNRFFGSLNQDFIEDGFLPRWFLFFQSEIFKEKKAEDNKGVFADIVDRVKAVQKWTGVEGNLASVSTETEKFIIDTSKALNPMWRATVKNLKEDASGPTERVFFSRLNEQATKVILCCSDEGKFESENALWVKGFTEEVLKAVIKKLDKNIFANSRTREHGRLLEKFALLLKPGQCIGRSELVQRTQRWCNSQERNQIIDSLLESGYWSQQFAKNESCRSSNSRSKIYLCEKT